MGGVYLTRQGKLLLLNEWYKTCHMLTLTLLQSYILYQERNILSTNIGVPASTGAALSRAGTRKRPVQPLVNFGAAASSIPSEPPAPAPPPVFEPGSLLARRS